MQGKGISLRLGLLGLVVVLVLSAVGGLSLAKDAFDGNDYDDCPAATRLDAVDGLAVDRTDEEDEIRISWDALSGTALSSLGPNGYRARLTVIVEGSGSDEKNNVALGDTSLVVDGVDFAKDLTISVAITLGDFVISDIAEKDFTSGMPAPAFLTNLKVAAETAEADTVVAGENATHAWVTAKGTRKGFYYLGFNDVFDNWLVSSGPDDPVAAANFVTQPSSPKFRVGLAHGDGNVNASDADFKYYRIVIEDGSGDLLGYQAQTVNGGRTYRDKVIVFGVVGEDGDLMLADDLTTEGDDDATPVEVDVPRGFTNIRLSNQVTDDGAMSPYYAALIETTGNVGEGVAAPDGTGLSYGNLYLNVLADPLDPGILYAEPPVQYFDFPDDVFEDDGNYVIKAWAEDEDGTRISPVASIELSAREGDPTNSIYSGFRDLDAGVGVANNSFRSWAADAGAGVRLSLHGFSIHDE